MTTKDFLDRCQCLQSEALGGDMRVDITVLRNGRVMCMMGHGKSLKTAQAYPASDILHKGNYDNYISLLNFFHEHSKRTRR
jgi:hypothetical protein